MTLHAQALARIEEDLKAEIDFNPDNSFPDYRDYISTLKAVMEIHHPIEGEWIDGAKAHMPDDCNWCGGQYPCPTADLIIKRVMGE